MTLKPLTLTLSLEGAAHAEGPEQKESCVHQIMLADAAEETGRVIGTLLVLGAGIVLVVLGVRSLKAAKAANRPATGGTVMLVIGIVLLVLFVGGLAGQAGGG